MEEDDLNLTDASMPLGALSAAQMAPVLAAKTRVADAAQKQADFYDRMEQEIRARRAGPTTSERLYELGAAMMAPTRVRGFSGTMGNILPVLQQQSQERRKGEESRQEALKALLEGRMKGEQALAGRDLATQLAMARLTAAGNKPPVTGETERMINEAMSLPEGDPRRALLLSAIRGSPQNLAGQLANRVAVIETTAANRAPPTGGSKAPPKYARGPGGKLLKWVP